MASLLLCDWSPDGGWMAYSSAESGTLQVYVAPFPATGAKWQISTTGGDESTTPLVLVEDWTAGLKK